MERIFVEIILGFIGLCMGSFAGATVWRLRSRQLTQDKVAGERVNAKEFKRLKKLSTHSFTKDRSVCLHCGHQLAWYDLIPLISWVTLRGKCRYCHKPIGWFEPVIELSVALFFVLSLLLWPTPLSSFIAISEFILWLVAGVLLAILAAYDGKWFILPDVIVWPLVIIGGITAVLHLIAASNHLGELGSIAGSVLLLCGFYLVLYIASKGKWIGFGDVKLGLALGLLLADWKLAFVALFAANIIGCLVILPGMLQKKIGRSSQVPFGPFFIGGLLVAQFIGVGLITWYTGLLLV